MAWYVQLYEILVFEKCEKKEKRHHSTQCQYKKSRASQTVPSILSSQGLSHARGGLVHGEGVLAAVARRGLPGRAPVGVELGDVRGREVGEALESGGARTAIQAGDGRSDATQLGGALYHHKKNRQTRSASSIAPCAKVLLGATSTSRTELASMKLNP